MEGDDDPTEAITDNVARVEWDDDDTVTLPAVADDMEMVALIHKLTNDQHAVTFDGVNRHVDVRCRPSIGHDHYITENAKTRTFFEALQVAAARLEQFLKDYDK